MKIFFDYSGRAVDDMGDNYKEIYVTLEKLGHYHLRPLTSEQYRADFYARDHASKVRHYQETMKLLKQSDVVVLEVSEHSLSMGFLMQKALELSRPVVALYVKGNEPFFAMGVDNDKLQVIEYQPDELREVLEYAVDYAQDQQDTRFNFFISPKHQNYLDWIAREKKIPRSVYLRRMLEEDMENNSDYS